MEGANKPVNFDRLFVQVTNIIKFRDDIPITIEEFNWIQSKLQYIIANPEILNDPTLCIISEESNINLVFKNDLDN